MSENCAACNLPIKSSRIRAKERLFHEDCFRCSKCQVSLESFFFKDGKLYCDPCETELFAKKCDHCSLPIQSTVVNVRGKSFHHECFTCSTCNQAIKAGFFYIEGKFVCDSCDSGGKKPNSNNTTPVQVSQPSPPSPTLSPHSMAQQAQQQPLVQQQPVQTYTQQPQPPIQTYVQQPLYVNQPIQPPTYAQPYSPNQPIQQSMQFAQQPFSPLTPQQSYNQLLQQQQGSFSQIPTYAQTPQISIQPFQPILPQQQQPQQQPVVYVLNNGSTTNLSTQLPQLLSALKLSGDVAPVVVVDGNHHHGTPPSNQSSFSHLSLSASSSNSSSPNTSWTHERKMPLINGKTLGELLRTQSFDEILTNVLANKTKVYNEIKDTDVEFGEVIAAGASGKVHKGRWSGKEVAIKVYSTDNFCFSREEFDREVSIMSLLNHECFTDFYGANTVKHNYLFHLSELIKGGSLRDVLLNKSIALSLEQLLTYAADIASAMKYLHSMGVIHRDLKSGNVLITEDLARAKLIDFGTSRAVDLQKTMTMNLGTSPYMAPEIFKNEKYSESCDVYSFGIVLWEIYCRSEPYSNATSWSIPVMVTKGERPPIPADCPSEYSKLIKACWHDKAKKRPTFKEIVTSLNKILGSYTLKTKKKR